MNLMLRQSRWLFATVLVLATVGILNPQVPEGDLAAFGYLGARFLDGYLLFEQDYETKFPLVQYLFAPVAFFQSLYPWKLLTLLVSLVASFMIARALCRYLSLSQSYMWLLSAVALCSLILVPGGFQPHLSVLASALVLVATAAILSAQVADEEFSLLITLAGAVLCLAMQLRPHLGFTLPAFFLLLLLLFPRQQSVKAFGWFGLGGISALLIGFSPYLGSDELFTNLLEGLRWIANFDSREQAISLVELFGSLIRTAGGLSVLVIFVYSTGFLIFQINCREYSKEKVVISLFVSTFSLGLITAYLNTHYFSHYTALSSVLIINLIALHLKNYISCRFWKKLAFFTFSLVIFTPSIEQLSRIKNPLIALADYERSLGVLETRRLILSKIEGHFYWQDNPWMHAITNQPRLGDGHPAVLDRLPKFLPGNRNSSELIHVFSSDAKAMILKNEQLLLIDSSRLPKLILGDDALPQCATDWTVLIRKNGSGLCVREPDL